MMSPPLEFHTVNAFANGPHSGSQAAVVLFRPGDARAHDDKYLVALASDFSWPATVFISPREGGDVPAYAIRWFTKEGVSFVLGAGGGEGRR